MKAEITKKEVNYSENTCKWSFKIVDSPSPTIVCEGIFWNDGEVNLNVLWNFGMFIMEDWSVSQRHELKGYISRFNSAEELWLAFTMLVLYHKQWNGNQWLPESSNPKFPNKVARNEVERSEG